MFKQVELCFSPFLSWGSKINHFAYVIVLGLLKPLAPTLLLA